MSWRGIVAVLVALMPYTIVLQGRAQVFPLPPTPSHPLPPISIMHPEQRVLTFTLDVNTDWSSKGREAVVLRFRTDGRHQGDIVSHGGGWGSNSLWHTMLLKPLPAGNHELQIDILDTPMPVDSLKMSASTFIVQGSMSPTVWDQRALDYAPILYGRDDNATTDTPLLLGYQFIDAGTARTIEYHVVWSHEDGGTPAHHLMSRWGRTVDIEWVYRATFNGDTVVAETIQGPGHRTVPFNGPHEGTRPLLQTTTTNNMVAPWMGAGDTVSEPGKTLRFSMVPLEMNTDAPRESLLDRNGWAYRISALEGRREGWLESPGDPQTPAVSDPRNYLYVDAYAAIEGSHPRVTFGVSVQEEGGLYWYWSDHTLDSLQAVDASGWRRHAIELHPGTPMDSLASLAIQGRGDGEFRVENIVVRSVKMLDEDFSSRTHLMDWHPSDLDSVRFTRAHPIWLEER